MKNEVLYFRGHCNKDYEILPLLARNREYVCDTSLLDEERNLFEMTKYQMSDFYQSYLMPIDLLALLQHYGSPTRLLERRIRSNVGYVSYKE